MEACKPWSLLGLHLSWPFASPLPARPAQIKLLLASLPRYLAHVSAHPSTLLLRFFGVHRVKPSHGLKVRLGGCWACGWWLAGG